MWEFCFVDAFLHGGNVKMRASMVCSANGTKTLNFSPPNGVENRGFLGLNELIFIK